MSSDFRPNLVSPSCALFVLVFSQMALAENTEHGSLASTNSAAAKAAVSAARDLIELMADRLELSEAIARHRWNDGHRSDDEKIEITLGEQNLAAIRDSGLDQVWVESMLKSQLMAVREFQRQLFASWKASGVYAFDDVLAPIGVVRARIDKNIQEQIRRLQELKGVLCSTAMIAHMSETASVIFARRKIEGQLLKPMFEAFNVHAREESGSCPNLIQGQVPAANSVQVNHAVNRIPN